MGWDFMSTPFDRDWKSRLGPSQLGECLARIQERIESDPKFYNKFAPASNFRAAKAEKSTQQKRFWKLRASGCCLHEDWTETFRGEKYLLGFDYGHYCHRIFRKEF